MGNTGANGRLVVWTQLMGIGIVLAVVLFLVSVGIGVVAYLGLIPAAVSPNVEWSELGQRGDFLSGHLGSAANAAGFLLLCAATIVQMRELARQERTDQDQQRSIDATLQALKDQATALSRQVDASIAQVGELREQTNKFEQLVNAMKDSRDYGRVLEMIRDRDGLLELIRTKAIDKQDGQRRVEAYESAIQAYTRKAVAHEIRPFLKMAGIDEN